MRAACRPRHRLTAPRSRWFRDWRRHRARPRGPSSPRSRACRPDESPMTSLRAFLCERSSSAPLPDLWRSSGSASDFPFSSLSLAWSPASAEHNSVGAGLCDPSEMLVALLVPLLLSPVFQADPHAALAAETDV